MRPIQAKIYSQVSINCLPGKAIEGVEKEKRVVNCCNIKPGNSIYGTACFRKIGLVVKDKKAFTCDGEIDQLFEVKENMLKYWRGIGCAFFCVNDRNIEICFQKWY